MAREGSLWGTQGKSYLSTILETFLYFNNQYRCACAYWVSTILVPEIPTCSRDSEPWF